MEAPKTTVRIERMTPEGQGLGRAQDGPGRVILVPYTAPGDRAEVVLERIKPGYAQGRLLRLLEPGPARILPPCPLHFQPGSRAELEGPVPPCGGCDWQHLNYAEQLKAKRALVRDCLARIGKLRDAEVLETIASPQEWRYRNKVQVPFGLSKGPDGKPRVIAGFYAPGSHRIVDFTDCLVQPEFSVAIALKVKRLAQELGWSIYDEDRDSGWLRHLFLRTNQQGAALVALVTRSPEFPQRENFLSELRAAFPRISSVFQNVQPLKTSVVLGPTWRLVWGKDHVEEKLGRLTLRSSPSAFLQVNSPACEILYDVVRKYAEEGGFRPELALDLYCGVGAIALWIAPCARRVLGVEENKSAVQDAWENARLNNARNARFLAGSVETALGKIRRELEHAASAVAVLDPPRSGCAEPVLRSLRAASLRRVVYVSCNPATLARDAAILAGYGYRFIRAQPVDLFPQTSHIETVSLFERT